MKNIRTSDLLASLLFITLAIAIIWIAIPLGVQEPKKLKFVALSPSYYPRLVSYCLLILGVFMLTSKILAKQSTKTTNNDKTGTNSRSNLMTLIGIAVLLFFYYWFLESLGFVVTSTIVLFVLMLLAGERNTLALITIPLITPLTLYGFFTKVANIPIPAGVLQPLLVGQ